ncbi:radical SAM protein [Clostridium paraputrificum]|uniref:radical SAM protein n=1 Tax=Clostridium paraputrificum TaxID=29363 RepID=UPI003D338717
MSNEERKKELYEQLRIRHEIGSSGINVDPEIFKHLDIGGTIKEQVNALFASDHENHPGIDFPTGFTIDTGFRFYFIWDKKSPYNIKYKEGVYSLYDNDKLLFNDLKFDKRPKYYNLKTSDGTEMSRVAQAYTNGQIFVAYSNECSLNEKGKDCLFCNINATKRIYGECQNIKWKTPKQIAETVAAAYKEGFNKLTISGGFVPERREVDYYIDVAEAIREETGLEDFNGTATIGAPLDYSVFDKYKEAGYRTTSINLEIWDSNIFKTICPGKDQECGGRDNWLKAIEYATGVFGKFRVRTTFVAGIEPKQSLLEGLEYFISRGVVAFPSQWNVNIGSALEGHRSPEAAWHYDVAVKTVALYRKYGLTWEQLYDAFPTTDTLIHDIFRIEEGLI